MKRRPNLCLDLLIGVVLLLLGLLLDARLHRLNPQLADQEVYGGVLPPYWEGTVTVSGTVNGRQVTGVGYVEMVAY